MMDNLSLDEILKAVKQLPIPEQEQLRAILNDQSIDSLRPTPSKRVPPITAKIDYSNELQWLAQHGQEYAGEWVAIDGNRLIAHGRNAREVFAAARSSGVPLPMVTQVDDPDAPPFVGV
jgi:hypothetical protein